MVFSGIKLLKVLIHLYHYDQLHASAIAKDYGVAVTPILNQFPRFEKCGILISSVISKSRVYSFNKKSPFGNAVKGILEI